MAREPEHRQQREQRGEAGLPRPDRVFDDGAFERKLLLAIGVEHAPIRLDAAAELFLPRLVDRFHHVVVDLLALGHVEPVRAGNAPRRPARAAHILAIAVRWPADFADHDGFAGRDAVDDFAQRLQLAEHEADRVLARHAFPVRQDMHGDEVDVADQFGIALPGVQRLGGRHRNLQLRRAHESM